MGNITKYKLLGWEKSPIFGAIPYEISMSCESCQVTKHVSILKIDKGKSAIHDRMIAGVNRKSSKNTFFN